MSRPTNDSTPTRAGITVLLPPSWLSSLPAAGADGFYKIILLMILAILLLHGYPGAV